MPKQSSIKCVLLADEETKEKLASLPMGRIPSLITEVTHRIERINLFESTEHKADVSGIINVALSVLEFEFKKGIPEELRIVVNDIRERCERVQVEFEANFDTKEERYVILADEFREYFRKKGFVPQSTEDPRQAFNIWTRCEEKYAKSIAATTSLNASIRGMNGLSVFISALRSRTKNVNVHHIGTRIRDC